MQGDYIGQEITIECWEGFEFTDTPAAYIEHVDNTQPLGGTWGILHLLILYYQILLCMRRVGGRHGNPGQNASELVGMR